MFHPNHGDYVILSNNGTEAQTVDEKDDVIFSAKPLLPGCTVKLKVEEVECNRFGQMYIGVTLNNPSEWDRKTRPREQYMTCCMDTTDGQTYINKHPGMCDAWQRAFGSILRLRDKDTVTLYFLKDGAISLAYNDHVVKDVFEFGSGMWKKVKRFSLSKPFIDTLSGPAWLVVWINVKRIAIDMKYI